MMEDVTDERALEVLEQFLHCAYASNEVFELFQESCRNGDVFHENKDVCSARFWYRPPSRKNAALLVAHADTYRYSFTYDESMKTRFQVRNGMIVNMVENACLGGDDRCGCALAWLFRNSGHGILITDGEENGLKGTWELYQHCPEIMDEITANCNIMIELDRNEGGKYKFYHPQTEAFKYYVSLRTEWDEYEDPGQTDISVLGWKRPSVNLAVGYHNLHVPAEYVSQTEWLETFHVLQHWLTEDMPVFGMI